MPTTLLRLIALSGFLAVLLGALGAHPLKDTLAARNMLGSWQTAAQYQLAHSIACLALVAWASGRPGRGRQLQRIVVLWLLGCLLFAGSIYALALGGPRLLGPVTPLGGLAFMAGWGLLGLEATRDQQS